MLIYIYNYKEVQYMFEKLSNFFYRIWNRWEVSIFYKGEKSVAIIFAFFSVLGIIAIPILHYFSHYPLLSCIIILFVTSWSIALIVSIVLAILGYFVKK